MLLSMEHLRKEYPNGKIAVDDFNFAKSIVVNLFRSSERLASGRPRPCDDQSHVARLRGPSRLMVRIFQDGSS